MLNSLKFYRLSRYSDRRSAPLALLALCLLAYLPLIYRLGFYWDDWPSIWFYHLWGPAGFLESFASDRPALAWVFMLTTTLIGESPAGWQVFGLLARWLASLAFWWTLLGVWPKHSRQAFWAAALFAVYPGFSQQYISVTYSNAFLVMALTLVSLGSMLWAYRLPKFFWPLLALSLLTQAAGLATTEYFFGFELLRPALLLLTIRDGEYGISKEHRILHLEPWKKMIRRWWPYLVVAVPFLIDRIFFHKTPRGQIILIDQMATDPGSALLSLLRTVGGDFVEVNFLAWFQGFDPSFLNAYDRNIRWLFTGIVSGAVLFTGLYLALQTEDGVTAAGDSTAAEVQRTSARHMEARWAWQAIALGVFAFLASGWTIWVTNLHIELLFPWDRFTLITMLGTSLLIAGLAGLLYRWRWPAVALLAILIGLAAGVQFQHRLEYRQEWLSQRNFLWQLAWRIPALQPGTLLLTSELPFTYYSDNSLTAPINWIYGPEEQTQQMPYLLYDVEARLGVDLPAIEAGQPIKTRYRATTFEGGTSRALVLFYDPPRCVKVVDPAVDRYLPVKPLYIREMTPLSQLALIDTDPASPVHLPEDILGPEPPHTWCYYFEKGELFGQMGDWEQAAAMAGEALKLTKHFTDKNVSELFPFIEAYAHTGNWSRAVELSLEASSIWEKTNYPLCDVWRRIAADTHSGDEQRSAIQKVEESLQCNQP